MSSTQTDELPPALAHAFAPMHKRAFGIAIGSASAAVVLLLTVVYLLRQPVAGRDLGLLRPYLAGYTVSLSGRLVGGVVGFLTGFVCGWFFAFCRNLFVATWIFLTRERAALAATREFLDHI